ncbi:MAG: hypothetical protein JXR37_02720 [Kiritimatiellae bacterium]|nr:hypothetical protein [Kiritimatiellia bacterium]
MITGEIRAKVDELCTAFVLGCLSDFQTIADLHVRFKAIERLASIHGEHAAERIAGEGGALVQHLAACSGPDAQINFEVISYTVQALLRICSESAVGANAPQSGDGHATDL